MILLEDSVAAAIHNSYKNNRDNCDYACGQKFANDMFRDPKMNVCRANCDVVWSTKYVMSLRDALSKGQATDPKQKENLRNRVDAGNKQLFNARRRLFKTKLTLKKVLFGRRASQTMKPIKNGPAFEKGMM